jgi:hypothetical protein
MTKFAGAILALWAALVSGTAFAGPSQRGLDTRFGAGLDFAYNDNVLGLSPARIQLFESGASPQQFRINSVDDFVIRPWVSGALSRRSTEFGTNLRVNLHRDNSIKNHELATFYVLHRFDRKDTLRSAYTLLHGGYAGELERPGSPGLIESKFFDVHRFDTRFQHRFNARWSLTPRLAGQLLLYDGGMNDTRTLAGFEGGLTTSYRPNEWLDLATDFDFEQMHAPASRADFDRSYRRVSFETGPTLRLLHGALVSSLRYGYAHRMFTTNNTAAQDPFHRDRADPAHQVRARVEYSWRIASAYLAYGRDDYRADAPAAPSLTDEETTFSRNLVTVGLGLHY